MKLLQPSYLQKIISRFFMGSEKVTNVPFGGHFTLSNDQCSSSDCEREDMMIVPYFNVVGSIMYTMISTQPDLAHAISVRSRFMANPGRPHWEAMKRLMRYLNFTKDEGLIYK